MGARARRPSKSLAKKRRQRMEHVISCVASDAHVSVACDSQMDTSSTCVARTLVERNVWIRFIPHGRRLFICSVRGAGFPIVEWTVPGACQSVAEDEFSWRNEVLRCCGSRFRASVRNGLKIPAPSSFGIPSVKVLVTMPLLPGLKPKRTHPRAEGEFRFLARPWLNRMATGMLQRGRLESTPVPSLAAQGIPPPATQLSRDTTS